MSADDISNFYFFIFREIRKYFIHATLIYHFSYFLCCEDIPITEADDKSQDVPHCSVVRLWSIGQWVQVKPDPETEDIYDWYTDSNFLIHFSVDAVLSWEKQDIPPMKQTTLKHVKNVKQTIMFVVALY